MARKTATRRNARKSRVRFQQYARPRVIILNQSAREFLRGKEKKNEKCIRYYKR